MESRNKIIEEAERKARELVEEARREAEEIIREAEKKWASRAEMERRRIIEEAEKEASYIIAEARRKANLIETQSKNEIIERVFNEAELILKQCGYDVKLSLGNLVVESINQVDKPRRIIVRVDQVEIAKSILRELGYSDIEVEGRPDIQGGVVIESESGVIIDNRIETRLKQARLKLLDKIAKKIWG